MGDIKKGLNQFELNRSEKLKKALLEDLKNSKKSKQVIQLNGKSSLVFANLTALTLASCGVVVVVEGTRNTFIFSINLSFNEDPDFFYFFTNECKYFAITVDSIPLT